MFYERSLCLVSSYLSSLDAFRSYDLRRSCSACLVRQPITSGLEGRFLSYYALLALRHKTPLVDIEQTVSRRSEPSSRAALMGEHPHLWLLLHSQVATSRHRCSKPRRRFELLGATTLLSPR